MSVKIAIIGAGARGQCYAEYAVLNHTEMEITAVAEPKINLREKMAEKYHIPSNRLYASYRDMLANGVLADGLFICTQDNAHIDPAVEAIHAGYKCIMIEKPIDKNIAACEQLAALAEREGATIQVCHSLRYTNFYRKLKEIIDSKIVGDVVHITHLESVGHFHYAHSFVRGDWNNSEKSSPMILAKCCHDTDLMTYLTGKECKSISSYGALTLFQEKNAPEGSAMRCIDDCKIKYECPYSAMQYFGKYKNHLFREYAVEKEGFVSTEEAMRYGRYGRCVYHSDNNVVDHQVVNMLFEDDVTAVLSMCAFADDGRETRIFCTMGEIYANMDKSVIEVREFANANVTTYSVGHEASLHGGADTVLVRDFIAVVKGEKAPSSPIGISLQSHKMCMAAERSRLDGGNPKIT